MLPFHDPGVDDAPAFATCAVSDEQVAEMNRDLADVVRNNEALTEAELELLARRADRDTAAALALSIVAVVNANPADRPADGDETRVSAHGYGRFKAFAKVAGGRWI